jgi:mRNA deadenylase 3'-5' endonuclease subunit Ccr4
MPKNQDGDEEYSLAVKPMRSAYKEYYGREPEFTNWAQTKDDPPFIDTLDYIFLSEKWKIEAVDRLPLKEELKGPLPTENEPSDHLQISANVTLIDY